MKRCTGNVRELLALELFAKGPAWIRGLPARFSLKTGPRAGFPGARSPSGHPFWRTGFGTYNKQLPPVWPMAPREFPGKGNQRASMKMNVFIFRSVRLISAALRAARPAKPVARERLSAPFYQHAEATQIAARRSIADCFFAAFCRAPAAGRLRASNPQIAARNPRFP